MPRRERLVIPGCPHHIVHRGNRGDPIFHSPEYYRLYLTWLQEYTQRYGVGIYAYCLMPNHVHLIAVPEQKTSLALAMGQTHVRYSRWMNHRHGLSGHL